MRKLDAPRSTIKEGTIDLCFLINSLPHEYGMIRSSSIHPSLPFLFMISIAVSCLPLFCIGKKKVLRDWGRQWNCDDFRHAAFQSAPQVPRGKGRSDNIGHVSIRSSRSRNSVFTSLCHVYVYIYFPPHHLIPSKFSLLFFLFFFFFSLFQLFFLLLLHSLRLRRFSLARAISLLRSVTLMCLVRWVLSSCRGIRVMIGRAE
jgi:hypothetical protein